MKRPTKPPVIVLKPGERAADTPAFKAFVANILARQMTVSKDIDPGK